MTRIQRTTIRSLAFVIATMLALAVQIAAANPAAKSQGLWVGGENYLSEFQGKALAKGGTPRANAAFGSKAFDTPNSIVFDRRKDLWIAYGGGASVIELSPGQIASIKSGSPTRPEVILRTGKSSYPNPFITPTSLAFDRAGDMWISDNYRGILKFLPKQIQKSGAPSPNLLIIAAPNFIPEAIRFDASDNLWVSQFPLPYEPSNSIQIARYAPGDRAASGPANPGLVVNSPGLVFPVNFAFDRAGNLWLAGSNSNNDELDMISAADLGGTGVISPSAAVSITSSSFGKLNGTGSCIGGIDFDRSGDLWVSVGTDNADCGGNTATEVVEFTPSQLSVGGNLTPSVTIGQNMKKTNLFLLGPISIGPTIE
jgi:hypothetical protein